MLRLGGSRVSRTGREESGPLSDPRQMAVRAMYKNPPRTSSAPSPIRNILASQFIAATHNRTGIQADARRFVPAGKRQSLGSSAGRCSGARWTRCGGPRLRDDRAGDPPDALVADKVPQASRKQAIDLQAVSFRPLGNTTAASSLARVRPRGGNWLPCKFLRRWTAKPYLVIFAKWLEQFAG